MTARRRRTKRYIAALHEAGHAVVASALYGPGAVEHAALPPHRRFVTDGTERRTRGQTKIGDVEFPPLPGIEDIHRAEFAVAGMRATHRLYVRRSAMVAWFAEGVGDLKVYSEVADYFSGPSRAERFTFERWIFAKADRVLDQHWPAVLEVARILDRHGYIGGGRIDKIVARHANGARS